MSDQANASPIQRVFLSSNPLDVLPKDYLETPEGLVFAVLSATPDEGRIPVYLRYRRQPDGGLLKLSTQAASEGLAHEFSRYRFWSARRGRMLQGVEPSKSLICHRALEGRRRLESAPSDSIGARALSLIDFLKAGPAAPRIGLTGSLLLGAEGPGSDIDLVVYRARDFETVRERLGVGLALGVLEPLGDADWQAAHARRGTPLSLERYCFHEARKANKALIGGVRFDLTLQDPWAPDPEPVMRTLGSLTLRAQVVEAREAFGFPARYQIDHPTLREILVFTQTYVGQALEGEWIEARGILEETRSGRRRLVVGSDRESPGHYLFTLDAEDIP